MYSCTSDSYVWPDKAQKKPQNTKTSPFSSSPKFTLSIPYFNHYSFCQSITTDTEVAKAGLKRPRQVSTEDLEAFCRHQIGTTISTAVITAPYQHTSSVTKEVETRQRTATSEFLCSAHKQGLSSESQQHPGATGLLLYSGSAHFRRLCTFPCSGWSSHDRSARGQGQDSVLEARLAHALGSAPRNTQPWLRSPRRSRPSDTPFPTIPVCRERDNIQQPVDTQTQLRAGDHTGSPSEQSAVVCRAAAGVKSH